MSNAVAFHLFLSRFFKLSLLCSEFHCVPAVYFCLRGGFVKIRRGSYGKSVAGTINDGSTRQRSCMMSLSPLNSDCNQWPIQTLCRARCDGKYRLAMAVICLLTSTLVCGCATGLMTMPGAAMLADRFGSDKEPKEEASDEKKKSKSVKPKRITA